MIFDFNRVIKISGSEAGREGLFNHPENFPQNECSKTRTVKKHFVNIHKKEIFFLELSFSKMPKLPEVSLMVAVLFTLRGDKETSCEYFEQMLLHFYNINI